MACDTINGKPKLKSDMKKQMSELYIRKIFYMFKEKLMSIIGDIAHLVKGDVEERIYAVSSFKDGVEIVQTIIFKEHAKQANCSCNCLSFKECHTIRCFVS